MSDYYQNTLENFSRDIHFGMDNLLNQCMHLDLCRGKFLVIIRKTTQMAGFAYHRTP